MILVVGLAHPRWRREDRTVTIKDEPAKHRAGVNQMGSCAGIGTGGLLSLLPNGWP